MNFTKLNLDPQLIDTVHQAGYTTPTPIQEKTIPLILQEKDILASAQTGTGKTASFLLPIIHLLAQQPKAPANKTYALILTPTRELAEQVYQKCLTYSAALKLRPAVVYGGVKINPQMRKLLGGVEILIATPGRLLDLYQQNTIKFDLLKILVLDEADRMLDMGFINDIKKIMRLLPLQRQTLLFSATFAPEIRNLAQNILRSPIEIDATPRNTTVSAIKQLIHPVDKGRKLALLTHLLHKNKWDQVLIFTKTKHGANKLVQQLDAEQLIAAAIHGNKSQAQRLKALNAFKTGTLPILVATDIASRGIDITGLPCVINFDLPQVAEDYIHRIGRTGRAGAIGIAISLVSADEASQMYAIEKISNKKIDCIEVEDFEPQHQLPKPHAAKKQPTAVFSKKNSRFNKGNKDKRRT